MVFASLEFLAVFLPAFLLVYALIPGRARNAVLLLASWAFYGWWNPAFLLLFIALTVSAWIGGLVVERVRNRPRVSGRVLAGLIAANLGILAWFKYANIGVATLTRLSLSLGGPAWAWQHVTLPIGLSFMVLQIVSYLVDIRSGRFAAERRLINFAAYLAMFGHLVAGPIIRYDWIRKRLSHRALHWRGFSAGSQRFMIGMAMKVLIADTLSPVVGQAFTTPNPSLGDAWVGCLGYTLQLYFDFAGYSLMAIGIGLMLGFRFPENFRTPYRARNLADFWRRWHISLSSWLRDYLFIPLGGSRGGARRTAINLVLTMTIGGLWHGADSWNFLYWGLFHGLGLAAVHAWRDHVRPLPAPVAHALTLLFVMLGWTLFRSPDLATALDLLGAQLGLHHRWAIDPEIGNRLRTPQVLAFVLGIGWAALPSRRAPLPVPSEGFGTEGNPAADSDPPVAGDSRLVLNLVSLAAFLLCCALIASRGTVPFLYFQF